MPRTAARPQSLRTRWIPIPRRGSRSFGRKNAYRGSRRRRITASRSIRRQVLIASGKNRLSSTMMRQMPVLAQSQDSTGNQSPTQSYVCGPCAPGQSNGPAMLPEITVTAVYIDAPISPAPTGVNLSPFFAGTQFAQYDPLRAFLQTIGVGAGGAAIATTGVAVAPLLKGPALGAALELTSSQINGYAAASVTSVIETEGYSESLETLESLGQVFRSLEVPEQAGPELPWSN
jgi:hypothetical protein